MAREILFELGKMITDRIPYKLGIQGYIKLPYVGKQAIKITKKKSK